MFKGIKLSERRAAASEGGQLPADLVSGPPVAASEATEGDRLPAELVSGPPVVASEATEGDRLPAKLVSGPPVAASEAMEGDQLSADVVAGSPSAEVADSDERAQSGETARNVSDTDTPLKEGYGYPSINYSKKPLAAEECLLFGTITLIKKMTTK